MLGPVESSELDIMSTYVVRAGTHKTNTDEPKKKTYHPRRRAIRRLRTLIDTQLWLQCSVSIGRRRLFVATEVQHCRR